jgi:hypothetical protein
MLAVIILSGELTAVVIDRPFVGVAKAILIRSPKWWRISARFLDVASPSERRRYLSGQFT